MNIRRLFTPKQKVMIRSIQHAIYRATHRLSKFETSYDYNIVRKKNNDVFFGYYDITPFNSLDELLFITRNKQSEDVDICISDSKDYSKWRILAHSKSWNWQQGCRLRWFPGSNDRIIFNFYEDNHYGARIIDKDGNKIKDYNYPLYDISHDGKFGLTLNFERLGVMRPGYGYTCKKYTSSELEKESIDLVDLSTNSISERICYRTIASFLPQSPDLEKCYINHLSFSPDDNQFLFFWIEVKNGYHQASLLVYNISTKDIIPIELEEKVSHYVWLDNDNILCTSYSNASTCRYYVYNVKARTKKEFCPQSLKEDGHPSVDNNSLILTDTYPNAQGYQNLYLVNSDTDTKELLLKVYMRPVSNGEWRTDLHPRFNVKHSKICIDTNQRGNREIIILNI